jgi:FkbM family methyltransferase
MKIIELFQRVYRKFYPTPQEKVFRRWREDNGDKTLRLYYPLIKDSVVFDLGGYEGQWTSDIFAMYQCTVHVFEPVKEFADAIKKRFLHNEKIHVHSVGLSRSTGMSSINISDDGSSQFEIESQRRERVSFICFEEFLQNSQIDYIDLIKINIEGAEYDLMDYLISSEIILRIKNIQIQFHRFVPDAETKLMQLQERLRATHRLTYEYPFVWENWVLMNQDEQI